MSSKALRQKLQAFTNIGHQLVIAVVFFSVVLSIFWSLNRYWQESLQPRLYLAAKTQASILAQSQAATLVATLENNGPETLPAAFRSSIQQMLIVEDPAIGGRYIKHFSLELDYDTLPVAPASLDFAVGSTACAPCFDVSIPLMGHLGDLFGVAQFSISDAYFQSLSTEMRTKLYAETSFALTLLILVWLTLAIMFHRLHRAKQRIEASDNAKTRFMANVTHELRTPLNAILGYTQLYQRDPELMQRHGHGIETINRSAEHLLLMINDILEFSRSNANRLTLRPKEVPFVEFLLSLVDMIRMSAEVKNLTFQYLAPDYLPQFAVFDEKRLRQVLLNLLHNAVKFTASGHILFRVDWQKRGQPHRGRLRFSVIDTGIGIAKHQLESIFIPFQQLDNKVTRAEGSGLGLTISQHIVHLMGGQLQVKSQPDQGSEFWFDLDLAFAGDEVSTQPLPQQNQSIHWPTIEHIDQIRQLASQHNILGLLQLLQQLETNHSNFVGRVQPFVRQYQFKLLINWLDDNQPAELLPKEEVE
jgi:signal transduction histidine kinase